MTFSFKPAIRKWASLGLASCLLAACHHETQQGTSAAAHTQPRSGQLTQRQAIEQSSPTATAGGDSAAAAGARTTAVANIAGAGGTTPAGTTATIDIIVGRNDTLDRIFRKLQLNLSDLANLRSMPGIKTHMDNLRLGESLHFVYRDDELDGFERRLNENETLKVVRGPGGLRADVLQNPLEGRTRTVRGVIDRSLFEAVTAAGAHDQTAVNLADMFQWDIDFILDVQPGDSFVVTYRELYQNGVYVKDGPVLAASFVNQGRPYFAVRYVDSEGAARYFTPDGRSLHKAFLRNHDANNWPVLREALRRMGRADLIGSGKHQLVPAYQPSGTGDNAQGRRNIGASRPFRTQHTGLPTTPRTPPRGSSSPQRSRPGSPRK